MANRTGVILAAALAVRGLRGPGAGARRRTSRRPRKPRRRRAKARPRHRPSRASPSPAPRKTASAAPSTASYGIANDLQTTTGSISDALRNIPSVEVDLQGNVSLRGDPNVTILVDGKPSGLFKGASAGQALQALPADSIERVEVITNPSAEFSPEGSAGIINLITKKTRKAGDVRLGARRAWATSGRRKAGVTGAYNSNKLTLTADVNGRYDPQQRRGLDAAQDPRRPGPSCCSTRARREQQRPGHLDHWGARAGVDYDLDARPG